MLLLHVIAAPTWPDVLVLNYNIYTVQVAICNNIYSAISPNVQMLSKLSNPSNYIYITALRCSKCNTCKGTKCSALHIVCQVGGLL